MRIGNRRISGFGKRFWALLVVVIGVLFYMLSQHSTPVLTNPWVQPAFPASELSNPSIVTDWMSAKGTHFVTSVDSFTTYFGDNVGYGVRFHVYFPNSSDISADQQLGALVVNKDGYNCTAGAFIDPTKPADPTTLPGLMTLASGDALQLCFRAGTEPTGGSTYEMTGLLWWRSDLFNPAPLAGGATTPTVPTVLITGVQGLSQDELAAPTTHMVNLDLIYEEPPLEMEIHRIEWSAGAQVRACVTLRNTSANTVPMWSGVTGSTADVGSGTVPGAPDPDSALAQQGQLTPLETVSGYLVFGSAASNPSQPLTITMPTLNSAASNGNASDQIMLSVPQQYITPVSQSSGLEDSSCDIASETSIAPDSSGAGDSGGGSSSTEMFPSQVPVQ